MPTCFDCGEPWNSSTGLRCKCPPGGAAKQTTDHRKGCTCYECHHGYRGLQLSRKQREAPSGSPDESTCPVELRGLGWRHLPNDRWEPAWVAVASGRDRIRGVPPKGCSNPEWYSGVEMVIDLSTLIAIARAEREENGIPFIRPEYVPWVAPASDADIVSLRD